MSFVLLDDDFFEHGKTTAVGRDARDLWLRCLAWSQHYRTDGFVPEATVRQQAHNEGLKNVDALIERLLTCYLPDKGPFLHRAEGGYRIHEYERYYENLLAKRAAGAERVRRYRERHRNENETADVTQSNALHAVTETAEKRVSHRNRNRDLGSISGSPSSPDQPDQIPVITTSAREAPAVPAQPPLLEVQNPPPPKGPDLGKPDSEVQRKAVDRHRDASLRVLGALNDARRRVNPRARGIAPSYAALGGIAGRLEAGKTEADCLHIIAVQEAEVRRDKRGWEWFDAVSPFRPENFERRMARDLDQHGDIWDEESRREFWRPRTAEEVQQDLDEESF